MINAPSEFLGVLSYEEVQRRWRASLSDISVDVNISPLYVAIVESGSTGAGSSSTLSKHYFVIAWRLLASYVRSIVPTTESDTDMADEEEMDSTDLAADDEL